MTLFWRHFSRNSSAFEVPRAAATALACALVFFSAPEAEAQNFFDRLFGGIFEGPSRAPRVAEWPRAHRVHRYRSARPVFTHRANARATAVAPSQSGAPAQSRSPDVIYESASASRSYCVRECDGYFFSVGLYSDSSDPASHQQSCGKLCPGARTSLYVMRAGSDKMEDAVAARGGSSYAKLMASLTSSGGEPKKSCSCHGTEKEELPTSAIYRDITLRPGDAVMTTQGMMVFHGGGRLPHKPSDFRPLAESRDLSHNARRTLAALDRVSRAADRRSKSLEEHRSQTGVEKR